MKENTNTCNLCCKRDQCKELCDDMKKAIRK